MKLKQAKHKARLLARLSKKWYGVVEIVDIHRTKGALKNYAVTSENAKVHAFENLILVFWPDGSMRDSKMRLVLDTFLMGNDDEKNTAQINRNSGRETDNGEGMAGIDLAQPDPFAPEILPSLRPGIDF
jgi:hypothetical protein